MLESLKNTGTKRQGVYLNSDKCIQTFKTHCSCSMLTEIRKNSKYSNQCAVHWRIAGQDTGRGMLQKIMYLGLNSALTTPFGRLLLIGESGDEPSFELDAVSGHV